VLRALTAWPWRSSRIQSYAIPSAAARCRSWLGRSTNSSSADPCGPHALTQLVHHSEPSREERVPAAARRRRLLGAPRQMPGYTVVGLSQCWLPARLLPPMRAGLAGGLAGLAAGPPASYLAGSAAMFARVRADGRWGAGDGPVSSRVGVRRNGCASGTLAVRATIMQAKGGGGGRAQMHCRRQRGAACHGMAGGSVLTGLQAWREAKGEGEGVGWMCNCKCVGLCNQDPVATCRL